MKNYKIMIGIPTLDTIKTETMISLFGASAMIQYPAQLHVHKGCYVHDSRNKIADYAIENGATHVMFVDSDMQFPADGIQRLIERERDVVGGLYFRRQAPHLPTINVVEDGKLIIPKTFNRQTLFPIYAVATGFLLVRTSVFKKLEPPYFYFGQFNGKEIGEDVYFCKKVNEAGITIYCDPTIPIGHVGEYVYDLKDYEAYTGDHPEEEVSGEFTGEL